MAAMFDKLAPDHRAFIGRQHVFFTASASAGSRINLSPKGSDCLRVLSDRQIVYLDQTGSGNETSAHLRADGRLTIMFCAFEGPPLILRLYGHGRIVPRGHDDYVRILNTDFDGEEPPGARQMILLDITSLQTSCGYAVPFMDFRQERETLKRWASKKGPDGIEDYWRQKNLMSIDGIPTGLADVIEQHNR